MPKTARLFSSVILLFFFLFGSYARAEGYLVSDEFTVTVGDTIERFGFDGEPISYTPSNLVNTVVGNEFPLEATGSKHVVYAAQGEREAAQLLLTSNAAGRTLTGVSLSDFVHGAGAILPAPDLYIVENLRKLDERGIGVTAYPDVLSPIASFTEPVLYEGGVRLLIDFTIPKGSEPGVYSGSASMRFADGRSLNIPIDVKAWDYEIPTVPSVTTQLFELDWRSIAYWYQLDPGSTELSRILSDGINLLKNHRFSFSKIPPFKLPDRSALPSTWADIQSNGVKFLPEKSLELHGVSFESLSDNFSIEMELNIDETSTGLIMKHKWHNRHSGYSLNFVDGHLSFEAAVSPEKATKFSPLDGLRTKSTLSTQIDPILEKNMIKVSVKKSRWEIYVNDDLKASLDNPGKIIPAYGAWVTLGSKKASFTLLDLKWVVNDTGDESVFKADLSDRRISTESADISEKSWRNSAMSSFGYLNDIREDRTFNKRVFDQKLERLGLAANERSFYLSLPFDEAYRGPSADKNIAFAQEVKAHNEGISVFHTFGSMRGRGQNKKFRKRALEKYETSVDIYSIRPSVYFEQLDFFNSLGPRKEVSMYIHDVNIVESENVLVWGRNYFWALFHLDIFKSTFWNTTLWFQPAKKGRAARRIVRVEDGFAVTSRNPSGLGAGMIFYPGKDGLVPSLRSIVWRDGLEDFESLKMLQLLANNEEGHSAGVKSAAQNLLERSDSQISKKKDFRKLPKGWAGKLRTVRLAIGELLHSEVR